MLTILTLIGYFLVIPYKRGGLWSVLKVPALLVAAIDVLANYTEWSWVFGWPPKGCHTISKRLDLMEYGDPLASRRAFAAMANTVLNAGEDDGLH